MTSCIDEPRTVRGALLAEGPHHGVGDVALAAPVGADDDADAGFEDELGLQGERLEALEAERLQEHVTRPRRPAARAPRGPASPCAGAAARPSGSGGSPTPSASPAPCDADSPPASTSSLRERRPRRRARRCVRRARDCSSCSASAAASCSARFLLLPKPWPSASPSTTGLDLELAVVRRAAEAQHLVVHRAGAARQVLLQLGLVVDVAALGELDVLVEHLDDGRPHGLVAEGDVHGADEGLGEVGEHVLVVLELREVAALLAAGLLPAGSC